MPKNVKKTNNNWVIYAVIALAVVVLIIVFTTQRNSAAPAALPTQTAATSAPTQVVDAPTAVSEAATPVPTSSLPDIVSVKDIKDLQSSGAFLLDVREQSEWDTGHIDGTTLIPLGQLADRLSELPKDKEIITICRSGHRSAQARDLLRKSGFADTTSMDGGMNAWTAAGYPVVTGK